MMPMPSTSTSRRRSAIGCSLFVVILACGDDGAPTSPAETSGHGSSGSTGAAPSTEALASTTTSSGAGSSTGSMVPATGGSSGEAADTGGWTRDGVCGQRGAGTVLADRYEAFEEFYLVADEGFGAEICVIRFDVARVSEGPTGCEDCLWTHTVEYGPATVLVDENGVCADSERGLDEAARTALEGTQVSYGFVPEYQGHASVLMKYDESTQQWAPSGNASWEDELGDFYFDNRQGFCRY